MNVMKIAVALSLGLTLDCSAQGLQQTGTIKKERPRTRTQSVVIPKRDRKPTKEQEQHIRALIEKLVFVPLPKSNKPIRTDEDLKAANKPFTIVYKAGSELMKYKELAIPILVEHLNDKRKSVHFKNHDIRNDVGTACYYLIYFQLQDRPKDYSRYGYSRKGRDGKDHVQAHSSGTPFDDAGGLKKWLVANKHLTYTEKQLKCLNWLLDKEKEIGASGPKSYFRDILPLEIQILKRELSMGKDVRKKLARLEKIKKEKLVNEIPRELLPDKIK